MQLGVQEQRDRDQLASGGPNREPVACGVLAQSEPLNQVDPHRHPIDAREVCDTRPSSSGRWSGHPFKSGAID